MFRDRLPLTVDGFNIYDKDGERVLMAGTNERRAWDGHHMAVFFVNAIHRNYHLPELADETESPVMDDGPANREEIQGEVGLEVVANPEPISGIGTALKELQRLGQEMDEPDEVKGEDDPITALMTAEGLTEDEAIQKHVANTKARLAAEESNDGLAFQGTDADEHAATTNERESDGGEPLEQGTVNPKPVEVAAILKRARKPGKRTLA